MYTHTHTRRNGHVTGHALTASTLACAVQRHADPYPSPSRDHRQLWLTAPDAKKRPNSISSRSSSVHAKVAEYLGSKKKTQTSTMRCPRSSTNALSKVALPRTILSWMMVLMGTTIMEWMIGTNKTRRLTRTKIITDPPNVRPSVPPRLCSLTEAVQRPISKEEACEG